jgi:hypothetical protein
LKVLFRKLYIMCFVFDNWISLTVQVRLKVATVHRKKNLNCKINLQLLKEIKEAIWNG